MLIRFLPYRPISHKGENSHGTMVSFCQVPTLEENDYAILSRLLLFKHSNDTSKNCIRHTSPFKTNSSELKVDKCGVAVVCCICFGFKLRMDINKYRFTVVIIELPYFSASELCQNRCNHLLVYLVKVVLCIGNLGRLGVANLTMFTMILLTLDYPNFLGERNIILSFPLMPRIAFPLILSLP